MSRSISFKPSWHLLVIGLGLLAYAWVCAYKPAQSDFNVPLHAAGKMLEKIDLYDDPFMDGSQYYYSPFFALILTPFAIMGEYQELVYNNKNIPEIVEAVNYVEFLWLLFNIFFLFRIWRLLQGFVDMKGWSKKASLLLFFLTLILVARPLDFNFRQVQMTIFLLWASLEGMFLISRDKKWAGAALLALAINVKIMPLLLVVYLLYRKEFKAVGYVVFFSLVLLFLPALFIGWDYNQMLLAHWFEIMNPVGKVNISPDKPENYFGFHSIAALVNSLFTDNHLEIRTHVVDLGYEKAVWIAHALRGVLVVATLYFLRSLPFKAAKSKTHTFYEIAYILAITPLIFPHQQKYSFFYLLPAFFYLVYFLMSQRKAGFVNFSLPRWRVVLGLLIVVFALTTLSSDLFLGLDLGYITQYLKLITWGALILPIPLALARPDFLKDSEAKALA